MRLAEKGNNYSPPALAIQQTPKPRTKRQMLSFLGMTNFCRAWIPSYAVLTQPLVDAAYQPDMTMTSTIQWSPEADNSFHAVKMALQTPGTLGHPNMQKPFQLAVDCKEGFMVAVLTQSFGTKQRPVAYYSTKLDPVARGLPPAYRQ